VVATASASPTTIDITSLLHNTTLNWWYRRYLYRCQRRQLYLPVVSCARFFGNCREFNKCQSKSCHLHGCYN
jgi:hypothetical protein